MQISCCGPHHPLNYQVGKVSDFFSVMFTENTLQAQNMYVCVCVCDRYELSLPWFIWLYVFWGSWVTSWHSSCFTPVAVDTTTPPLTALWWAWLSQTSSLSSPCPSGPWTRCWTSAGPLGRSCARLWARSPPWTCTPVSSFSPPWAWHATAPWLLLWRWRAQGAPPLGPSGPAQPFGWCLWWPHCLMLSTPPLSRFVESVLNN